MIDPTAPPHDWTQGAVACADLGVFSIDAATRALMLDPRAAEMLGLGGERELTLEELLATIDPGDRERVARSIDAALAAEGEVYHQEFRTEARRWITADGRTRAGRSGARTLLGVVCDVTLRRTTEDARSRLFDEMARSLRFNDMLIGIVAHDLRTPLAAVTTAAEVLQRQVADPVVHATSERIGRSGERMSRIVDQLLDVTRARLDGAIALRTRETGLGALVAQVAAEIMAGDPRAAIEVEARADTTVVCDPDRVGQVFANLLGNAVRHGSDAAQVRVVVDGTASGAVSATVRNPGAIAPEALGTLFNPFRRVHADAPRSDKAHGLGLGLYIARRIALGHGGEITVTSSDAGGTAFRIDLPRVATASAFSLTPERAEEEQIALARLGGSEHESRVTAALFGVLPIHQRAPEAFEALVERHMRLLRLALDRQIYREARADLAAELRTLAEQLGAMGAGAGDVAELHSHALQRAIKGAPAVKAQALVSEGRLLALELMGRLVTYYRKRSGFGSLARGRSEAAP